MRKDTGVGIDYVSAKYFSCDGNNLSVFFSLYSLFHIICCCSCSTNAFENAITHGGFIFLSCLDLLNFTFLQRCAKHHFLSFYALREREKKNFPDLGKHMPINQMVLFFSFESLSFLYGNDQPKKNIFVH